LAERQVDELDDPEELGGDDLEDDDIEDEVVAVLGDKEPDGGEGLETDAEADDEDDDDEDLDEDAGDAVAVSSTEDDDSDETSLDELLAKRSAKRVSDDSEEDIMSLVGQDRDEPVVEPLPVRAQPIRDRQEFVCSRCRLVKPKVQLADAARGLCRDCV
jgi:hypothetical protein